MKCTRALACAALLALTLGSACLSKTALDGPYRCDDAGACPAALVDGQARTFACDEGLCCVPEFDPGCPHCPVCPTLPSSQALCPDGGKAFRVFEDRDGDRWGQDSVTRLVCARPRASKAVEQSGDCDDTRADINPGARDGCDGFDNNCNGRFDDSEPPSRLRNFFRDADGDGYGDPATPVESCAAPPGTTNNSADCDDNSVRASPDAGELCNGQDDNCNNAVDEGPLLDSLPSGASHVGVGAELSCVVPNGRGVCLSGKKECRAANVQCVADFSASLEHCNGVDDDCDGLVDEAPECGGPEALFGPNVRVTLRRFEGSPAPFQRSCPNALAGATETRVVTSNVVAAGTVAAGVSSIFTLTFEPLASGATWDLTAPNGGLRLPMTFAFSGTPASAWGDGGARVRTPVAYLCGGDGGVGSLARLVPSEPLALLGNATRFESVSTITAELPWLFGVSSGIDLSAVRSLSLLIRPTSVGTLTWTFDPSFGFVRDAGAN